MTIINEDSFILNYYYYCCLFHTRVYKCSDEF